MSDQIKTIQWDRFAQPEWNEPDSVANALSKVLVASDETSCSLAYDSLLYALGNNHAGTYYPVLLAVMPVLEAIIIAGETWPQRAALSAIDDLFGSFQPELGYEHTVLPDGGTQDVETVFRSSVHRLRDVLERIAECGGPNASLAAEMIYLLED